MWHRYDGTEPEQPQAFIVFGKEHKGAAPADTGAAVWACGGTDCPVLSPCCPPAETASVALQQTLWSLLAAFVQLATTAYLNWMAYRPMQKVRGLNNQMVEASV